MINILFLIGTNNKNSLLKKIANDISKNLDTKKVKYEVLNISNLKIINCDGCRMCFKYGYCKFESKDDVKFISNKIKKSDLIIVMSSVYSHNIPGKFKSFIDRISYKMHLLEYSGKVSLTITSTFSNGSDIVRNYLNKIETNLGIKNIKNYEYIEINCKYDKFIEDFTKEFNKIIDNNFDFYDKKIEFIFNDYKFGYNLLKKKLYESLKFYPENEFRFWNQNWISRSMSYSEFVNRKKENNYNFIEDKIFLSNVLEDYLNAKHEK